MVDLNGDGKNELLFTIRDSSLGPSESGVFALTIPDDIMNGTFENFTLANNFNFDQQSLCLPYAIRPDGNTSERAHVLVAGA